MVHDQACVVGMADDHHFEVGSRWLSITFRLSTEYVCGADGIGQEGVRHVPVLSLAYFDDVVACWEILSTGEQTYQCRVAPNLRSLVAWHGLVTQGAQRLHVIRLRCGQAPKRIHHKRLDLLGDGGLQDIKGIAMRGEERPSCPWEIMDHGGTCEVPCLTRFQVMIA